MSGNCFFPTGHSLFNEGHHIIMEWNDKFITTENQNHKKIKLTKRKMLGRYPQYYLKKYVILKFCFPLECFKYEIHHNFGLDTWLQLWMILNKFYCDFQKDKKDEEKTYLSTNMDGWRRLVVYSFWIRF